jgi:hypothetical protein
MPKVTVIRCRTCGRVITRYRGHKGLEYRMKKIREHYKKYHPRKFRLMYKKAIATKVKKGIVKEFRNGLVRKFIKETSGVAPQILKNLGEQGALDFIDDTIKTFNEIYGRNLRLVE